VVRRAYLVVLAACSFEHGVPMTQPDDASTADVLRIVDAAIDAPADARICPAAPPTCTAFTCASSTSCYYVCGSATTGKQSYAGALGSCANANVGCVVTINDQAENDCIATKTLPSFPSALVWFGFDQSASGSEPAGGWSWRCGTSSYVAPNWGQFEPNNQGGSEDCAALTAGGAWLDVDCTGTARFVCELP
jgi:hypothetical protein